MVQVARAGVDQGQAVAAAGREALEAQAVGVGRLLVHAEARGLIQQQAARLALIRLAQRACPHSPAA